MKHSWYRKDLVFVNNFPLEEMFEPAGSTELEIQYEAIDWMTRMTPSEVSRLVKASSSSKLTMNLILLALLSSGFLWSLAYWIGDVRAEVGSDVFPPILPSANADDFFDSPLNIMIVEKSLASRLWEILLRVLSLFFKY
jgi:hypothetical protein